MSRQDGRCNRDGCTGDGAPRYSYGVYAGFLCRNCAIDGFRDACGLLDDGRQGDPNDLDEPIEADVGYGEERW